MTIKLYIYDHSKEEHTEQKQKQKLQMLKTTAKKLQRKVCYYVVTARETHQTIEEKNQMKTTAKNLQRTLYYTVITARETNPKTTKPK